MSQDQLFCIHSLDSSMLIGLVDWLNEYLRGNYRQPVVRFHSKLPNAISVSVEPCVPLQQAYEVFLGANLDYICLPVNNG